MNSYIESQRMSLKQFFSAPNLSIMKVQGQKIIFESLCWWIVPYYQDSIPFSRSVLSESLQSYGLQHARLPCPSPTPSSVQLLFSHVWLFATPWTTEHQASLSIANSWSLLKLISIESVMPSNHLILCCPLLLPPSIFPSIRVLSKESVLHIRWPKYSSFSFSISPSNEYSVLISFRMDWLDLLQSKGLSRVFSNTTVQKHKFFSAQLSL